MLWPIQVRDPGEPQAIIVMADIFMTHLGGLQDVMAYTSPRPRRDGSHDSYGLHSYDPSRCGLKDVLAYTSPRPRRDGSHNSYGLHSYDPSRCGLKDVMAYTSPRPRRAGSHNSILVIMNYRAHKTWYGNNGHISKKKHISHHT